MKILCKKCGKCIGVTSHTETHLIETKSPKEKKTKQEITDYIKSNLCWECYGVKHNDYK